jgi:hypothetical protein
MSEARDTTIPRDILREIEEIFSRALAAAGDDYDETLESEVARTFFENNFREAEENLLSKTQKLRVSPLCLPPRNLRFELDRPYLRQEVPGGPLELHPGPITGQIVYRRDLFAASQPPDIPTVAVILDRQVRMFHPNVSLREGFVCAHLPAGVVSLETLLPALIAIFAYSVYRCSSPLNREAAELFATRAEEVLRDLPPMEALY